jgi:hypothetical protein
LRGQVPVSPDCVFDASLVPGTCLGRFLDLKGLINKFLESGNLIHGGRMTTGRISSDASTSRLGLLITLAQRLLEPIPIREA